MPRAMARGDFSGTTTARVSVDFSNGTTRVRGVPREHDPGLDPCAALGLPEFLPDASTPRALPSRR
jgi:hypothetical protein